MEAGVAGELGVTLRDTIVWDIQGVPLTTRIANLREVNWARFEPNFFVVFPGGTLEQAPQTWVILTREDDASRRGTLQRRLVERFPNVTTIDISLIQQAIEKIVSRVVLAIRVMALFSLATGGIVLLGALATSRFQRLRESALLKTLGATRRQVTLVMFAEYLSLGALAALVGITLSTAAGWALTRWVFEIKFAPPWLGALGLVVTVVALTVITGFASGFEVYRKTALEVLRAE
jgi:putative ABC transport system permease protein